jgi:DNA-directed RNA polymerase II subunit RPB1
MSIAGYIRCDTSDVPLSKIQAIQYSWLSDYDIEKSGFEVKLPGITSRNQPVTLGVNDLHNGTTNMRHTCQRCNHQQEKCIGHPSFCRMRYPLPNPNTIGLITWWLKAVCWSCGRLRFMFSNNIELSGYPLLRKIIEKSADSVICPWDNCRAQLWYPYYGEENPYEYLAKPVKVKITKQRKDIPFGAKTPRVLYFNIIKSIFDRISYDTLTRILGLPPGTHPTNTIHWNLYIPPVSIRPESFIAAKNQSTSNSATISLSRIISINAKLPEEPIRDIHTVNDDYRSTCNTMVAEHDQYIKGTPQTTGSGGKKTAKIGTGRHNAEAEGINTRTRGKTGHIRGSLLGKRVGASARCVITGSGNIPINCVGVPLKIAKEQYVCEVVSSGPGTALYKRLDTYYQNGETYPGAYTVERKDNGGSHFVSKLLASGYKLQVGDIIERHLIEGDIVGFGRQPSLSPSSLSVHRVIIIEGIDVLQMNPSSCIFYNADFDGDCMILIIFRLPGSIIDAEILGNVANNIISYSSGSPLVGGYQDSLVTATMLSSEGYPNIHRAYAMQMVATIPASGLENKNSTWDFPHMLEDRKNMITRILPNITIKNRKTKMYSAEYLKPIMKFPLADRYVNITAGKFESGVLDSGSIGQGARNGIVHTIFDKMGPAATVTFLSALHRMASQFFIYDGFNISHDDMCGLSEVASDEAEKIKLDTRAKAEMHIANLLNGTLTIPINKTSKEHFEDLMISALSTGTDALTTVFRDKNIFSNGLAMLVFSGSKGSVNHIMSLTFSLGSTFVSGRRPSVNVGFARSSIFYPRFPLSPESRGYVPDSLYQGISPGLYEFACAESRMSLVTNALATSQTGKANRDFVTCMNDKVAGYRYEVKKANKVIQALYGGNGFDCRFIVKYRLHIAEGSDAEFKKKYFSKESPEEFKMLVDARNKFRNLQMHLEQSQLMRYSGYKPDVNINVDIEKIIDEVCFQYPGGKIDYLKQHSMVVNALEALPDYYSYGSAKMQENRNYPHMQNAVDGLRMAILSSLNIAMMKKRLLSMEQLQIILDMIGYRFLNGLVDPGKAVGNLAAQSYCNPLTQFMLDAKHRVGAGTSSKISPIKMVEEVVRVVENPTEVCMFINLLPQYQQEIESFAASIKMHPVENYVERHAGLYRSFESREDFPSRFSDDAKMIKTAIQLSPSLVPNISKLTNWMLRLKLNMRKMLNNGISLETVVSSIRNNYRDYLWLVHTDVNSVPIIWIWMTKEYFKSEKKISDYERFEKFKDQLLETVIQGIDGIISADVMERPETYIDTDGSVQKRKNKHVECFGSNLEMILCDYRVDRKRTISTSVHEMNDIYGIVIAKNIIYQSLEAILPSVGYSHISLFVNEMTSTGILTGISGPGITMRSRQYIGQRMAFGDPISALVDACKNGYRDDMNDVCSKLSVARMAEVGSFFPKVAINSSGIMQSASEVKDIVDSDSFWD